MVLYILFVFKSRYEEEKLYIIFQKTKHIRELPVEFFLDFNPQKKF